MTMELQQKLKAAAAQIRKDVIEMTYRAGRKGGHLGGALSMCEIMAVLYAHVLRQDAQNPQWPGRDRVILSKGHGALAQYAALSLAGFVPREDMWQYKDDGFYLAMHPRQLPDKGLECASGSLGQGLSIGVGVALALRSKHLADARVFVILGDGEIDEGSIWEAAMAASHYGLSNLVGILDANKLQNDGACRDVLETEDLAGKWRAFGWAVNRVDGHDLPSLCDALSERPADRPLMVIADTVKGKGVSFAENNYRWHNAPMTETQYRQAMMEQGVEEDGI